jgi:branched-chain amino acid aminotransferase
MPNNVSNKMRYFWFDGNICDEIAMSPVNRAFLFGDSVFETIRLYQGKPLFLPYHFNRMAEAGRIIGLHAPVLDLIENWYDIIAKLAAKNGIRNGRCRLMVFRAGGGFFIPDSAETHVFASLYDLEKETYGGRTIGNLGIHPERLNIYNSLSSFKTGSAIRYITAGSWAATNGFADCVLRNQHGRISEATSSNVWIYCNQKWITPPLVEACVNGVFRRWFLDSGIVPVREECITEEQLFAADEIFLTNALWGIMPVIHMAGRELSLHGSKEILKSVSREILSIL